MREPPELEVEEALQSSRHGIECSQVDSDAPRDCCEVMPEEPVGVDSALKAHETEHPSHLVSGLDSGEYYDSITQVRWSKIG